MCCIHISWVYTLYIDRYASSAFITGRQMHMASICTRDSEAPGKNAGELLENLWGMGEVSYLEKHVIISKKNMHTWNVSLSYHHVWRGVHFCTFLGGLL